MTYKNLKRIAQPHIREGEIVPFNSLLLLIQLHIPFKTKTQCEADYGGKMTPLYNRPAFLANYHNEKVIYFNPDAPYWNFYVFHEIAHYILGHEQDSSQNEIDADMLACILTAPAESLPKSIKSASDLSLLCKIPIDKAEVYWQEIKNQNSKFYKKPLFKITIAIILLFVVFLFFFNNTILPSKDINNPPSNIEAIKEDTSFYVTSSGTHYHTSDCWYIKNKTNVISISQEETLSLKLKPCKKCIY